MAYDYYAAMDASYNYPPEVRAALSRYPEFGNAVSDVGTPMGAAIAELVAQGGGVQGERAVKTSIVAGTLIAQADGTWKLDDSAAGKSRSLNVDSVQNIVAFEDESGVNLRIDYGGAQGSRLVVMTAQLDWVSGMTVQVDRASPTQAVLAFQKNMPEIHDYIYYDIASNTWKSSGFSFSQIAFTGGKLVLTHFAIDNKSRDRLSVTPRGNKFRYNVHPDANPVSGTTITLEVRENEPAIDAYIHWDGVKWQSTNPDKIWINRYIPSVTKDDGRKVSQLVLGHIPLSGASDDRVVLTPRGPYMPTVGSNAGPLSASQTVVEFYSGMRDPGDSSDWSVFQGVEQTQPTTLMRFYIQRGGSTGLAPTPSGDMKLYVRHGGGVRYVDADEVAKTFVGSRINFLGLVETA